MRTIHDPAEAARILADGNLVALPTETVYGLGARADDPAAVAKVYAAKGRPADHPVIVHVADLAAGEALSTEFPEYARALATQCWPGPMTLVVKKNERVGSYLTGGQDTVGIRVPNHPLFLETLLALDDLTEGAAIGIAAPSANRFGRVSPTTAAHVRDEFDEVLHDEHAVLDGGPAHVGVESTIIDCTGEAPVVLRAGAITAEHIENITGLKVAHQSDVRAPGTLASHYAPNARVIIATENDQESRCARLHAEGKRVGVLALAHITTPEHATRLASPQTTEEYAAQLYAALRHADDLGLDVVVAVPPGSFETGLEQAVWDRLTRAAHQ